MLVGHEARDFADCRDMWTNPEVTRFIGGKPSTPTDVWARVLRYIGHWSAMGFGFWVAREKSTNRFVGELGFADFKRDLDPSVDGVPELGYALAPWCYGQGFATEAVRAAVAWGDAHFGDRRTWALINPEAKASRRVAEKCGYRELKHTTMNERPIVLFERA